mmetsp:Transcript_198/g.1419  ORF Transcript_198/g.1419 Transcript_198/m.1419 type:complete len:211 (+) Transcript_198:917-1549(+)
MCRIGALLQLRREGKSDRRCCEFKIDTVRLLSGTRRGFQFPFQLFRTYSAVLFPLLRTWVLRAARRYCACPTRDSDRLVHRGICRCKSFQCLFASVEETLSTRVSQGTSNSSSAPSCTRFSSISTSLAISHGPTASMVSFMSYHFWQHCRLFRVPCFSETRFQLMSCSRCLMVSPSSPCVASWIVFFSWIVWKTMCSNLWTSSSVHLPVF